VRAGRDAWEFDEPPRFRSGCVWIRSFQIHFLGAAFWITLFAALAVFGPATVVLRAESANTFFKRGETAEAREDYDAAFDLFQKAYAKDPKDLRYRTASTACA